MPNLNYRLSTLRNRINGKCEILVSLTFGHGKRVRGKTKLYTSPDRWNDTEQRLIMPRNVSIEQQDCIRTQRRLNELSNAIMSAFMESDETTIDKAWLFEVIDRFHFPEKYKSHASDCCINDIYLEYVESSRFSEVRRKNTHVVRRIFRRFQLFMGEQLVFSDLHVEIIRQFEQFCREEYRYAQSSEYIAIMTATNELRRISPRGENSIIEIMRRFRTFIRWSMERDFLQFDPFRGYKIGEPVYGKPYYITLEERDQIAACDLSARPALAVQRDIFVFQCCIGCRLGDYLNMTKNNVANGAVEYIPHKTIDRQADVIRVPLNSIATEIYKRYADNGEERLLPFICEQRYNDAIKEIFRIAGVARPVTIINPTTGKEEKHPICDLASSHMARRTFVGNLYKQAKDLNLVCSLSGHVPGSKAVARYYDVDEEMRRDLVAMLE